MPKPLSSIKAILPASDSEEFLINNGEALPSKINLVFFETLSARTLNIGNNSGKR